MNEMKNALKIFIFLTILTGIIYPIIITLIAQVAMPNLANGSLLEQDGKVIGSALIAQKTTDTKYFWPRPSAVDYNPIPSGGSNLGPTSEKLKKQVEDFLNKYKSTASSIPPEMVYASGSGLDPHINIKTAYFQVDRIAEARSLDPAKIKELINQMTEGNQWGFLGPRYVNVLLLNQALDKLHSPAYTPLQKNDRIRTT
jgi:K+-transporting ATPase ATPase C chain